MKSETKSIKIDGMSIFAMFAVKFTNDVVDKAETFCTTSDEISTFHFTYNIKQIQMVTIKEAIPDMWKELEKRGLIKFRFLNTTETLPIVRN